MNYYITGSTIRIEMPDSKRDKLIQSKPDGQIDRSDIERFVDNGERIKFAG